MRWVLILYLLIPATIFCQTNSEIMEDLANNFSIDNLKSSKILYSQKFKSSISEATSIFNLELFQLKIDNNTVKYRLDFLENNIIDKSIFFDNSFKEYTEFYHKDRFFSVSNKFKKTSYYEIVLKLLNPKNILLNEIGNKKFINHLKYYQFITKSGLYNIFKNKNGYQFTSINFSDLGVQNNEEIIIIKPIAGNLLDEFNEKILFENYSEFNKQTLKEVSKNDIGKRILDNLFSSIKEIDTTKKFFLIDMFYQSCLPCVKSIPILNKMKDDSLYKNCLILGVDPILRDTSNMDKFIKRYNIKYDIIYGATADLISKKINLSSYPTTLIVNRQGNLIYIHTGILFSKDLEKIKSIINK